MKQPNLLILVHIEEAFRDHFPDSMYVQRLIRACGCGKYARIVHCTSYVQNDHPIEEIRYLVSQEIDWGWGYEPCLWEEGDDERRWLIESYGHEWTWIPPELRNGFLRDYNVYLGGGCASECLADMEAVLNHLDVPFSKVRGYVY